VGAGPAGAAQRSVLPYLSDRHFTDHSGKLLESAKIVVLLWPRWPPHGEIMNENKIAAVELEGKDLPAYCPNPAMPLWSSHPRVFLDFGHDGVAKCPYCGTEYMLKPGTVLSHH
jgi:uncharacterized Zn-finger protein